MENTQAQLSKTNGFISAWQRWRERANGKPSLARLNCLPIGAERISVLSSPETFRTTLLAMIAQARQRILMTTLYLQDDEAGQEVLSALYAAKKAQPQLEVAVFVDWHRAQRGLIGKARSAGNAALYREMAQRLGPGVEIYGVPIQRRELLGVMHLKGFIIDDCVLYSGASLNNVYLQRNHRYRLDRYHLLQNRPLADSMAGLLTDVLRNGPSVYSLNTAKAPKTVAIQKAIVKFRRELAKTHYRFGETPLKHGEVGVTPLIGLGVRDNELNAAILQLIQHAEQRLVLFTPYFNLPGPVRKSLDIKIKAGCQVTIVLGDKTANDFYIPPNEPFKAIGALPYLYEANLRRFCRTHQRAIDAGTLNVHIWRDGDNSFHLKGLLVDEHYALLTGNNFNPRAWRLDLENGLLIHDPHKLLLDRHLAELDQILAYTQRLRHHKALDAMDTYPIPVQRLIKRLARVRADRLVNQVL